MSDITIQGASTNYPNKKSVFTEQQLTIAYFLFGIWLIVFVDYIFWWFTKTQSHNNLGFILITIVNFWVPSLALYFFFFSLRQRETTFTNVPKGRVAMITTKIPSEPLELIQRTLIAMLNQNYPTRHDVWLADENPTADTIAWCKKNKVSISTRKNNPEYHNQTHPRKAKTKEGNLMYFYDHWGYRDYDFVVQFDADHAPEPEFLFNVMKEFNDPEVGYVSTPSICDGNPEDSWTVQARCYWESTMHGPIQSGNGDGFVPLCFGSHYSHRIAALKDIGGIGPEIAEDHTTTMLYAASKWKGAFARNAIAHGFGAVGLLDSLLQEYQWATVSVRALFNVTPYYFRKLSFRAKFQFFIWELWYPVLVFVTLISYLLPVFVLFSGRNFVSVDGKGFVSHYLVLNAIFIGYVIWLKSLRHLRPFNSWQISWETFIFQIIQFPWIMIGVFTGLYEVIKQTNNLSKIKITDKVGKVKGLDLIFFIPHFLFIAVNAIAIFFSQKTLENSGFYWFSWMVVASHSISLTLGVLLTLKESFANLEKGQKLQYVKVYLPTIGLTFLSFVITIISFNYIYTR